MPLSMKA